MKIRRERIYKVGRPRSTFEAYFTARARVRINGVRYSVVGWGSTPEKAKLNLLWQSGRRRNDVA